MEAGMIRALVALAVFALAPCAVAQVTEAPAGPAKPAQKPKVEKARPPKGASVSTKTPLQDPGAVFAGLIGSCWQAPLEKGNTDTHCFTVAFNGKLVMDVHKVRNASHVVVYEGVSVYRPDAQTRSLSYDYTNSFSAVIKGQAWRASSGSNGAELSFSSQAGTLAKAETTWRITGDGYQVAQADPKAAKLQFKRIGPAGQGF
jgi:hypothetical protein